jgi:Ca2+-binding RTX toxin-like protein
MSTHTVTGTSGPDRLQSPPPAADAPGNAAVPVDHLLLGLEGNDTLVAGRGHDTLNGGPGVDVAVLSDADSGLARCSLDLAAGKAASTRRVLTLLSIEEVYGGKGADTLRGSPRGRPPARRRWQRPAASRCRQRRLVGVNRHGHLGR